MEEKIQNYTADIEKYTDKKANKKLVEALAKRLASVMGKADAKNVACGDPKELERVRRNFVKKALDFHDIEKSRAAMEEVCKTMKKAKMKSRVTFYYLLATELKKAKKYIEG
jgi:hypothetical protein